MSARPTSNQGRKKGPDIMIYSAASFSLVDAQTYDLDTQIFTQQAFNSQRANKKAPPILETPRKCPQLSAVKLRSLLPRRQVLFLLRRQFVQLVPHRLELQPRNFLVEMLRHNIHLRLQVFCILHEVFRR